MRPLTGEEKSLIVRFADELDAAQRQQLLADMEHATAYAAVSDESRIMFDIMGYERPPYRGQHPFNVEASMLDSDGTELSVLLHVDENGRLLELEFIRWDSSDLLGPKWDTLQIF